MTSNLNPLELVLQASIIVQIVMGMLLLASIVSWAIMLRKRSELSRARADAVVQYLAVQHKIPLRRFVTPMGYGKTDSVADNTTREGRSQNRRVDVKMIINRGLNQPAASSASPTRP